MPVKAWFAEKVNYTSADYNKTLHFTQIVWKATKLLGVGLSFTANGGAIAVCNYYPRGNYLGQFVQNVDCS
jgi:glioma pathogenesis-related protein 2